MAQWCVLECRPFGPFSPKRHSRHKVILTGIHLFGFGISRRFSGRPSDINIVAENRQTLPGMSSAWTSCCGRLVRQPKSLGDGGRRQRGMNNDCELDIIRSQVSTLIDQGVEKGLSEQEQAAITAEVNRLWARLSQARPKQRRGCFSTAGSRRKPRPPFKSR